MLASFYPLLLYLRLAALTLDTNPLAALPLATLFTPPSNGSR